MRRKTKIIATLGPAVESAEAIDALVEAGMDVARLNFSHGTRDTHRRFFQWVRQSSHRFHKPVAILQDIQGPRIRVGTFPDGSVTLERGAEVMFVPGEGVGDTTHIHIENLPAVFREGAPDPHGGWPHPAGGERLRRFFGHSTCSPGWRAD